MTVKRTVAAPFLISALPLVAAELDVYLLERMPPVYYNCICTSEGVGLN